MESCAFVFPGQGSQFVGMGADLAREFKEAREVFEMADDVLGFSLSRLCFDGPEEQLRQTEFTQPAVVVTSLAAWRALQVRDLAPAVVAGHSVGEYSALAAAGVIAVEDCMRLVRRRGQLMQAAGDERPGGMAAVFGFPLDRVETLCATATERSGALLEVANINSPEQIVVSGDLRAVEAGEAVAKEMGARRYIRLPVSAAFHSSLMSDAANKLVKDLDRAEFSPARCPVVANVTASPVVFPNEVRDALSKQVAARVRWVESVNAMLARGVNTFIEVGPGTALSGMIRKINRDAKVLGVQDAPGVLRTVDALTSRAVQ